MSSFTNVYKLNNTVTHWTDVYGKEQQMIVRKNRNYVTQTRDVLSKTALYIRNLRKTSLWHTVQNGRI